MANGFSNLVIAIATGLRTSTGALPLAGAFAPLKTNVLSHLTTAIRCNFEKRVSVAMQALQNCQFSNITIDKFTLQIELAINWKRELLYSY